MEVVWESTEHAAAEHKRGAGCTGEAHQRPTGCPHFSRTKRKRIAIASKSWVASRAQNHENPGALSGPGYERRVVRGACS